MFFIYPFKHKHAFKGLSGKCLHNLMQIDISFSLTRLFPALSCQVWRCSIKTTSQTESSSRVFNHLLLWSKQEAEQGKHQLLRCSTFSLEWHQERVSLDVRIILLQRVLPFHGPRRRGHSSLRRPQCWAGHHVLCGEGGFPVSSAGQALGLPMTGPEQSHAGF